MVIDLKRLAGALRNAGAGETVPYNDTEPYLIEEVYEIYRAGGMLKISDLDYSRFELDDLGELHDYFNRFQGASYTLEQFEKPFRSAAATARGARAFC